MHRLGSQLPQMVILKVTAMMMLSQVLGAMTTVKLMKMPHLFTMGFKKIIAEVRCASGEYDVIEFEFDHLNPRRYYNEIVYICISRLGNSYRISTLTFCIGK